MRGTADLVSIDATALLEQADAERARAELGFAPATVLEDGLAAELDWVLERLPQARSLTAS